MATIYTPQEITLSTGEAVPVPSPEATFYTNQEQSVKYQEQANTISTGVSARDQNLQFLRVAKTAYGAEINTLQELSAPSCLLQVTEDNNIIIPDDGVIIGPNQTVQAVPGAPFVIIPEMPDPTQPGSYRTISIPLTAFDLTPEELPLYDLNYNSG